MKTDLLVQRLLQRWYWLLGLIVLGGVFGWAFAQAHSPVYECAAVIRVRLDDMAYAAERQVDVVNVNLREDTLGWVEAVFEQMAPAEAQSARIQRFESRWLLTVWTQDAGSAAALSDAWSNQALDVAAEYVAAAQQAQQDEWRWLAWQACLKEAAGVDSFNACAGTDFASLGEVPAALDALSQDIQSRRVAARHFSPNLTFEKIRVEQPRKVLFSTAWLTLAGALVGLLAGLVLIFVRPE